MHSQDLGILVYCVIVIASNTKKGMNSKQSSRISRADTETSQMITSICCGRFCELRDGIGEALKTS